MRPARLARHVRHVRDARRVRPARPARHVRHVRLRVGGVWVAGWVRTYLAYTGPSVVYASAK